MTPEVLIAVHVNEWLILYRNGYCLVSLGLSQMSTTMTVTMAKIMIRNGTVVEDSGVEWSVQGEK